MNKYLLRLTIAAAALTHLGSCTRDVLSGQGSIVTETRTLPAFDAIEISGNRQVTVVKSTEYKVDITGYTNLAAVLRAPVANKVLRFDFGRHLQVKNDNISLKIYTPDLRKIQSSGSSNISVSSGFGGDLLRLYQSGAGRLEAGTGSYHRIEASLSGSGEILASAMDAGEASIDLSGSGKATLKARQNLRVRISGSGTVGYLGTPQTDINISGSGKVTRL